MILRPRRRPLYGLALREHFVVAASAATNFVHALSPRKAHAQSAGLSLLSTPSRVTGVIFIAMRKRVDAKLDDGETRDSHRKLHVLHVATSHSFPTADIEEMIAQIERGYSEEPS